MSHIIYPDLIPRNPPPLKPGRGERLCREILRERPEGWLIGSDPSDPACYLRCSPGVIEAFRATAVERANAGLLVPIQWGHNPDNGQHVDDPQKVVDYFEEFWVESHDHGQSVWAACYPGPRFEQLRDCKLPVSPHLHAAVADGTGKVWHNVILHVALVDHATMPRQNGFVAMALPSTNPKGPTLDISAIVEVINKLLAAIDPKLQLPTTIADEAGLTAALEIIMPMVGGGEEAPDPEDSAVVPPVDPNAAVAMALAPINKQLAALNAELAILKGAKAKAAQDAFTEAVDGAIAMGLPAASRDALLNVGKANGWNVSELEPFKAMAGISLGLKTASVIDSKQSGKDDETRAILREAGLSDDQIERQLARLS